MKVDTVEFYENMLMCSNYGKDRNGTTDIYTTTVLRDVSSVSPRVYRKETSFLQNMPTELKHICVHTRCRAFQSLQHSYSNRFFAMSHVRNCWSKHVEILYLVNFFIHYTRFIIFIHHHPQI